MSLLVEIGALGGSDPSASLRTGIGIVPHTHEALIPAYGRASGATRVFGRESQASHCRGLSHKCMESYSLAPYWVVCITTVSDTRSRPIAPIPSLMVPS